MKKLYLILPVIMILLVVGCGESGTKTCTIDRNSYTETDKITGKDGKVSEMEMTFVYDNSLLGGKSLKDFSDEQKEMLKKEMLNRLGLEKEVNEGLEVKFDMEDQMKLSMKVDVNKVDKDILSKIGVDFSGVANTDYSSAIKTFEDGGYTCK